MNSGTYYLYEYKHDRRIRTAGFLKLTCAAAGSQLQLYARGLPPTRNESLKLFSFHTNDTVILPEILTEMNALSGNLCVRLSSAEYPLLTASSLSQIDGFFLVLPDQTLLAAVAPDIAFDTRNIQKSGQADTSMDGIDVNSIDTGDTSPENTDTDVTSTDAADTEDIADDNDLPNEPHEQDKQNDRNERNILSDIDTHTSEISAEEITPDPKPSPNSASNVRKLHRCDLSGLPRKQWYLANNSFLLHGCHNYGHLILFKEEDRYWLGVPGIYDPKEARAAEMFGFPKFTDSYNDQIPRTEDEENSYGTFGYWCRAVFPDAASPLCF